MIIFLNFHFLQHFRLKNKSSIPYLINLFLMYYSTQYTQVSQVASLKYFNKSYNFPVLYLFKINTCDIIVWWLLTKTYNALGKISNLTSSSKHIISTGEYKTSKLENVITAIRSTSQRNTISLELVSCTVIFSCITPKNLKIQSIVDVFWRWCRKTCDNSVKVIIWTLNL